MSEHQFSSMDNWIMLSNAYFWVFLLTIVSDDWLKAARSVYVPVGGAEGGLNPVRQ
jgi:hypothetical protein